MFIKCVISKKRNARSEKMENETQVTLENTGEIDLPTIDVKKHIGKDVDIISVTEHKGNFGYYVKIETESVETIEGTDKNIELTGTRMFGLQEDKDKNIGWGKDTKLGVFLKKMKVKHYNDLIGMSVKLQTKTSKDGVDFLEFN